MSVFIFHKLLSEAVEVSARRVGRLLRDVRNDNHVRIINTEFG